MMDDEDLNPVEKTLLITPETPNIDGNQDIDDDTQDTDDDTQYTDNDKTEIRLINEGAYGCIYYPGLACNGKLENKRYITKIQRQNSTTDNEWAISRRIRKKMPAFRNYFAPISKQCPVKIAKKYVNDVKKCDVFKNETADSISTKAYVSNKIRFLGNTTIDDYFKKIGTTYPPMYVWRQLIQSHVRLVHGIRSLLQADILHMDIKSGNIMVEPIQHHPIIIDFGISAYRKTMKPESVFYIYDTYTPWCFEIVVCNYIVQKIQLKHANHTKVSETEIDELIQTFQYGRDNSNDNAKLYNRIFYTTIVPTTTIDLFRKTLKTYMSAFIGMPWKHVYDHLCQTTYTTWDSYAVSVLFMRIFDEWKEDTHDRGHSILNAHNGTIFKQYLGLLEKTVFVSPNERISVKDTLAQLKRISGLLHGI